MPLTASNIGWVLVMLGASERTFGRSSSFKVHRHAGAAASSNAVFLEGVSDIAASDISRLGLSEHSEWNYIRAIEKIAGPEFDFLLVGLRAAHRPFAIAPLFRLDYRVDDSLGSWARSITNMLGKLNPGLVVFPALIMGNPYLDECPIGIPEDVSPSVRQDQFGVLLDAMSGYAAARNIKILGLKDVSARDAAWAHCPLADRNFSRIPSLPVAELPICFGSIEGYLATLSPKTRSDLRRKQRQSKAIRTEVRESIDGIEDKIVALYRQTQARRKLDCPGFDEVPPNLFAEVMRETHGRGRLLLCWLNNEVVCFNLFLASKNKIIGKYIGMNYAVARDYNLYFVNWLAMVDYAIKSGVAAMQVGQTSYAVKVKLGCELHPSWIYFKHTGKVRGPLFRLLAPLAGYAQFDPDLGRLVDHSGAS